MADTVQMSGNELRQLSMEFRTVAGRLIRTDFEEGLKNTTRFVEFIEGNPIIWDFVQQHNQRQFDMRQIVENKPWNERFDVPTTKSDEIAFTYQLLRYIVDSKTPLYSLASAYSASTKYQDQVAAFTQAVVAPFAIYISNYLSGLVEDSNRSNTGTITVNVSGEGQANVAIGGSQITAQNIHHYSSANISELVEQIVDLLAREPVSRDTFGEVADVLRSIQEEVTKSEPRPTTLRVLARHVKDVLQGVTLTAASAEAVQKLWQLLASLGASP